MPGQSGQGQGQGVAPGFSCGVGTTPRGRVVISISAQLDTVWQVLDSQYKGGGNVSADPQGYLKHPEPFLAGI